MEINTWKPQLRDILKWDADRTQAIVTIPAIQAMWPMVQQVGDAADVAKAALVYSLYETTVEDQQGIPRAKWELTRLVQNPWFDAEKDPPDEALLSVASTWDEFCLVHLGMHKSTASKYKRVWQVYHKRLGYGLDDLVKAGVFALGAAVGTLDRQLRAGEGVDQRLITALFGSPTTCSACSEYVPFLPDAPPPKCPHCGEDYQGTQRWSGPRIVLLLNQIKQEMQGGEPQELGKLDMFASLEHSFDDDGEVAAVSLLAECGVGKDERSSLPGWEINIISDDAPIGELGIRQSHLKSLEAWLRRKFPGA